MRQVSAALRTAIDSPERTVRLRLNVDFDGDGHGPPGSIDDLSDKANSATVTSVLQGTLPDQVNVVEGTAAATVSVDLSKGDPLSDARLDAVRYFSVYGDGPLAGKERLNRDLQVDVEFLTTAGWQAVPLLRGVTRDGPLRVGERKAAMSGIDYRSKLRRKVQLPAMAADAPVFGNFAPTKPGLEGTWIVSYVLWQCGFPLSPVPPAQCVLWIPMHGSAMPFIGAPYQGSTVSYSQYLPADNTGSYHPVRFGAGPFVLAIADGKPTPRGPGTIEIFNIGSSPATGTAMFDSNGRTAGRISGWFKDGSGPQINIFNNRGDGPYYAPHSTPQTFTLFNGASQVNITGPNPPHDGGWHFCGVHWDDLAGIAQFNVDGAITTVRFTTSTAAPGADNDWNLGGTTFTGPAAELQISTGISFTAPWPAMQYTAPATVDRSALRLDGIVGANPMEGWQILQELATAEQGAAYITADGTPTYATRARLLSSAAQTSQKTLTAAGHLFDLAYTYSLDRIANVVTGDYQAVTVASQVQVWATQELFTLGPGGSITVQATYSGLATTARTVVGQGNTVVNGSGAVYAIGSGTLPYTLTALSDTVSQITITNRASFTLYLVNNQGQPYITLVGDQISQAAGALPMIATDEASRAKYDDQPLSTPTNRWVQTKTMGGGLAMATVGDLANPQPVFAELPIPGDPTLEYFDRLTVVDEAQSGVHVDVWVIGKTHTLGVASYDTSVAARPARNRYLAGVGLAGVDLVG